MEDNTLRLPSTFYRVTARALIFDDQNRLLVCLNKDGDYEIPGGGVEHGETLEECIRRELDEELHAKLTRIGSIAFVYSMRSAYEDVPVVRIGVRTYIDDHELRPDDTIVEYRYVTCAEFMELDFTVSEGNVKDYMYTIWEDNKREDNDG